MSRFRVLQFSVWLTLLIGWRVTACAQADLTQPDIRQPYLRQAGRLMMQMDFERLRTITSALRAAAASNNDKGTLAAALMFETVSYALQNKPLETLATYRKLPPLAEFENDRRALVYVLNLRSLISYFRDDLKQTRADAERSLSLSDPATDQSEIAVALVTLSWVQIHDLQLDEAEAGLRRSLALFEQANEPMLAALSLNNLGVVYERRNQRENALKHHRASLALSDQYGLRAVRHYTLMNLGDSSIQLGQLAQALDYYQQCLAERRTRGNSRELATAWRSVAQAHRELHHFGEAIRAYEECLKVETALGDKRAPALRTYNIGGVYLWQEDFGHALDYLQRSLALAETLPDAEVAGLAAVDLSQVFSQLNQSALALDYAQRGLRAAEATQDRTLLRMSSLRLVDVYGNLAQFQQALTHLEKAATYVSHSRRDHEMMDIYFLKIWLALELGELNQAETALREAHALNERLQHPLMLWQQTYWQSRWEQARGHHEQALNAAAQTVKRAETLRQDGLRFMSHTQHGALLRRVGHAEEAQRALDQAIAASERLRAGAIGDASQQAFTHVTLLAPYHEMIGLLIERKKFAEAWNYAERAKGRALLNVLQPGNADRRRSLTAPEQAEEAKLETALRSLNLEIANAQADMARLAALEPQQQKARLALESFQTALYAKHPQLRMQRGEMQPLTLDEARQLLNDQPTAWLEYVVTDERTYLFVLTLDAQGAVTVQAHEIAITRQALAQRVTHWQRQLAERDPAFRALARQLATLLLEPARAALANKTRLVIVPDDALWELPFQALPLKSSQGERYLLESHTLSYAPSFTVLREMTQRRSPPRGAAALLAFGNPALPSEVSSGAPSNVAAFRRNTTLAPLPSAEREVKTLAQLYGATRSQVFIGSEAREAEAKRAAGQFDVLHFATHGVLNNANPMYSHLMLARSSKDDGEDGLLEAREVMRLDLRAELVVLSACETARGKIGAGEGVIGLSWAFFVAGAPATLVSQWKVESLSTTDLMLNFYRQRATNTKAAALRQAALKLMQRPEYKHPFYWAGFVLIGDGR